MAEQDWFGGDIAALRQPWDAFGESDFEWKSRCRGLVDIAVLMASDEPSLAEYLRWAPALSLRAQLDEVDVWDLLTDDDLELTVVDLDDIDVDEFETDQFSSDGLAILLSGLRSMGLLLWTDWKANPWEIRDGLRALHSYPVGMSWEWFEAAAQDYEVTAETGERFHELLAEHSRAAGAAMVSINTESDSVALGFIPIAQADAAVLRTSEDIEVLPRIR
ncbi:hypothetical protein [Nocardia sp. NPDC056100]|uniref:DUF6630 family protein n=1 Tax=Nocardia sp. NPDC056100 TaxID=3345712 RepID=UPI0035E19CC5